MYNTNVIGKNSDVKEQHNKNSGYNDATDKEEHKKNTDHSRNIEAKKA